MIDLPPGRLWITVQERSGVGLRDCSNARDYGKVRRR